MRITVTDLHFTYPGGVEALRGVNLTLESGAGLALIGENGAGKSTLARHLNGLLLPGSGRVLIGDWDTRAHSVARLAGRVGYVFQNPDDQLFARTVHDEVAFGPRNLGHDEATVRQAVAAALEQVGLGPAAARHPYDLQVADRKLVALATILAMRPPVLVLDEPTMGQDARGVARVGQIVDQLLAEGRTVLTISHDIDFCADHFARVVVMADGQVQADGPATRVLTQTALLETAQVEPPQLVRLAQGLNWLEAPLTEEGFLNSYRRRVQGKE